MHWNEPTAGGRVHPHASRPDVLRETLADLAAANRELARLRPIADAAEAWRDAPSRDAATAMSRRGTRRSSWPR